MDGMRAIDHAAGGGPEVLAPVRHPIPEPGPSEVLIKVSAAGVNGPDLMQRRGLYPAPKGASPLLGLEVSGEIVSIGEGAARWSVGERVTALTNGGGYAEYVAVEATHCLALPHGVSETDAAGLPETYFTVWSNLFHDRLVAEGTTLLVHGGAGGIGSTAIQLGRALGLRVFATEAPGGLDFCRDMGAERAIDHTAEDFVDIVRGAGGADLILDIVGGPNIAKNIKVARHDARIVQLAFNAGSDVTLNLMPIMLKRLTYTGSTLRTRPSAYKAAVAQALEERVWPHFAAGRLKPVTHTVLPLEDAAEAHRMMEAAEHRGKILLAP